MKDDLIMLLLGVLFALGPILPLLAMAWNME